MTLAPELINLAERLLPRTRAERTAAARRAAEELRNDAARRNMLGAGFYADDQRKLFREELETRASAVWHVYRRVLEEARVAWSPLVEAAIVERLREELDADLNTLEEMARDFIVPHGHGFDLFLRDSAPRVLDRIVAEVQLFALRQTPRPSSLGEQLRAPRYEGPAEHWRRASHFRAADPPDLLSAAREAVHAVEGIAKIVAGSASGTLGDCLKALRVSRALPSIVVRQLELLWGFASELEGVRHGTHSGARPSESDLTYLVESAEAAGRYLLRLDGTAL